MPTGRVTDAAPEGRCAAPAAPPRASPAARTEAAGRRRVGPVGAGPGHPAPPLRPRLPPLVPGRMGGTGEDPRPGRRPAGRQPRRRHPGRRPGDHARHRGGAGPARVRAGRLPVPVPAGRGHGLGPGRRGGRPPGQRLPAAARPAAAGPGLSRRHQGHREARTPSVTGCAASAGAASSRSPCGPACRWCRSPWWAARRPCRSWPSRPAWPSWLGIAYVPIDRQHAAARPARPGRPLPGQVQAAGPRPGQLRRAARPGALPAQPGLRGGRSHPAAHAEPASTTCCAPRRSVWFG